MVKYTENEVDAIKTKYQIEINELVKNNNSQAECIKKQEKEIKDLWDKIQEGPDPTVQIEDIPGEPPCSELLKTAQENHLELARKYEGKLTLGEEEIKVLEAKLEGLKDLEQVEDLMKQRDHLRKNIVGFENQNNDLMKENIKHINNFEKELLISQQLKTDLASYQKEALDYENKYLNLRKELQNILASK